MRTRWLILALLAALGLGSALPAGTETSKVGAGRISRLIARLGNDRYAERQQATRDLDALGVPALDALQKAIDSPDKEISRRALELVARIEKQVVAAAALAPTRVHLVCKDLPVTDAVAQLARKAGFEIQIAPASRATLAARKVTLDTGKVSFWEALDKLCQKAGLVEVADQPNTVRFGDALVPMQVPQVFPLRPVRIQGGIMPVLPRIQLPAFPRPQGGIMPILPIRPPIKVAPLQKLGGIQIMPARRAVFQQIQIQGGGQIQLGGIALPQQGLGGFGIDPISLGEGPLTLTAGKPEALPTCYAGAFRIRLKMNPVSVPIRAGKGKKVFQATFTVTAEPRLRDWSLTGNPAIKQAIDDLGQKLVRILMSNPQAAGLPQMGRMMYTPYGSAPHRQQAANARFESGEKKARALKELTGTIDAEVTTAPATLIIVDDVLKAAGKTVRGKRGGTIRVLAAGKDKNGNYQVRLRLEKPAGVAAGNAGGSNLANAPIVIQQVRGMQVIRMQVRIQMMGQGMAPNPSDSGVLSLVDAKGNAFPLVGVAAQSTNGAGEETYTFQAQKGREPVRLIYTASQRASVGIPFRFANVRLP